MSIQKYVLPEGKIQLAFDPDRWSLLKDGVLDTLWLEGFVTLNTNSQAVILIKAKKISLVSGASFEEEAQSGTPKSLLPNQNFYEVSIKRIVIEMINFYLKESANWLIRGTVQSKSGETPIVIAHSEIANIGFYSLKRDSDIMGDVLPPKFRPWMN